MNGQTAGIETRKGSLGMRSGSTGSVLGKLVLYSRHPLGPTSSVVAMFDEYLCHLEALHL